MNPWNLRRRPGFGCHEAIEMDIRPALSALALAAAALAACGDGAETRPSAADHSPMASAAGETPSDPAMAGKDAPARAEGASQTTEH
jgi:hypothetical protein